MKIRRQNKNLPIRHQQRSAQGISLLELVAVLAVMPIVAIICVNIAVSVFIAGVNDAACKDAARAAGQRSNANDAAAAARAVVARYESVIGKSQVSTVFETFPDKNGEPQIDSTHNPNVTVRVRSNFETGIPIIFSAGKFASKVDFDRAYSFPILNPRDSSDGTEFVETNPNQADNAANRIGKEITRSLKKIERLEEQAALLEAKATAAAEQAEASRQAAIPFDNAVTNAQNAYDASPTDANLAALSDAQREAVAPDRKRDNDAEDAQKAQAKSDLADARLKAEMDHLAQLENELEIAYDTEASMTETSVNAVEASADAGNPEGDDDDESDSIDEEITEDTQIS